MLATVAAGVPAYVGCYPGHAGFFWFPFVPLFFIGFLFLLFFVVRSLIWRRRGFGPGFGAAGYCGPAYGGWGGAHPGAGAEAVLAERYARGEIDEAEYRARLETLRTPPRSS